MNKEDKQKILITIYENFSQSTKLSEQGRAKILKVVERIKEGKLKESTYDKLFERVEAAKQKQSYKQVNDLAQRMSQFADIKRRHKQLEAEEKMDIENSLDALMMNA